MEFVSPSDLNFIKSDLSRDDITCTQLCGMVEFMTGEHKTKFKKRKKKANTSRIRGKSRGVYIFFDDIKIVFSLPGSRILFF